MKYKIQAFATKTGIPASALRYYDKENILNPSYRDQNNGYRYYDEHDLKKAACIALLRKVDFSIAEIKDTMIHLNDEEDLVHYLQEKKQFILIEILKKQKLIQKIDALSQLNTSNEQLNQYPISFVTLPKQRMITRVCHCSYNEMGADVQSLYEDAKQFVDGHLRLIEINNQQAVPIFQLALPIKNTLHVFENTVELMPETKGIQTIHHGNYQKIKTAYEHLLHFAELNKLLTRKKFIQIYTTGRGKIFKGNAEKYTTEIILPYSEFKEENKHETRMA